MSVSINQLKRDFQSLPGVATNAVIWLSLISWVERLVFIALFVILVKLKPVLFPEHDVAASAAATKAQAKDRKYPKVAIQLPMCNEGMVCGGTIDASASMQWPAHALVIQVLDDSTDIATRQLIDGKVEEWKARGVNIECIRRTNKEGYKAGNLRQGLKVLNAQHPDCQYIAIMDADHRPSATFLLDLVKYLENNQKLAFTQTRFTFRNGYDNLLTKAQELHLTYCNRCEGNATARIGLFCFYHGAGVVLRKEAIESCGGWQDSANEDMQLSVRFYAAGYRGMFVDHVTCCTESTSSFATYRNQQERWVKGNVAVWKALLPTIWNSKQLPLWRKVELLIHCRIIRRSMRELFYQGFVPICLLGPFSLMFPGIFPQLSPWWYCYMPLIVGVASTSLTPKGLRWTLPYLLFINSIGLLKLKSVWNGWLEPASSVGDSQAGTLDWVPTGASLSKKKKAKKAAKPSGVVLWQELFFGIWLLAAGGVGFVQEYQVGLALMVLVHGFAFLTYVAAFYLESLSS